MVASFRDDPGRIYKPVRRKMEEIRLPLMPGFGVGADGLRAGGGLVAGQNLGFILNDLANEFDPLNPNFGEKFAPPFTPVSFRDYNGEEITRVYSDQYGSYNALVPSTYTANAPIPSGMGPNMLQACMNDAACACVSCEGRPG